MSPVPLHRRDDLLTLCRCLTGAAADLPQDQDAWMRCLATANAHLVSPALWIAVRHRTVPPQVTDYLKALHDLNAARNRRILTETLDAAAVLGAAGIVPAILKGGAFLVDGQRPPGWRILSDVDLLVSDDAFPTALRSLQAAGWRPDAAPGAPHEPAVTLLRERDAVTLDLHRCIGAQATLLPAAEVLREAVPVTVEGVRVALPSATHRVLHNLLNTQVFATNHRAGVIALRQVLDVAVLAETAEVDWAGLDGRLADHGLRGVLHAWLHMAHALVAAPIPTTYRQSAAARAHLQRCLWQLDHPAAAAAARLWAAALHPFRRSRLGYLYPGLPSSLLWPRHAAALWQRHGLRLIARFSGQGDIR